MNASRRKQWLGRARLGLAGVGVLAFWLLAIGAAWRAWFLYRSQPPSETRALFQGVLYERRSQRRPWPMIVHVVTVDLRAPGIGLVTTPSDRFQGHAFRAQTTGDFLASVGAQAAINAGYFYMASASPPGESPEPAPGVGDPVDALGFGASAGRRTSGGAPGYRTLAFDRQGRARIDDRVTSAYNAVSGMALSLAAKPGERRGARAMEREPRTAVALDATGDKLLLVVIDGRQPNYSEGATLDELAEIVRRHGGASAINLDGGGSSTLVVDDGQGRPRVLNSPIHLRVPGLQRPVANHLGVFARPLDRPDEGGKGRQTR
jgi:hypothetical protein